MVVRIYRVKYECIGELHREEAEKLADFLNKAFDVVEDSPHYYISEDFEECLDEEDIKQNQDIIELLKQFPETEITLAW